MRYLLTSLFCVFTLSLSVYGQVPDYIPTDGLVAWYPFNGNANDESGNGLHGTVSGAILAPDQNGNNSSAYYFDGDDKIEIAHNNILNVTEMTLRISFKTFDNPLATPNGNSLLMSKREPSGWGSSFEFSGSASFGSSWSINGNGSIAGPNLMHGNWYDVVYVHRNDSIKIYIHNVLVFEDVSPGVYNSNSLPLVFGMRGNGWHQLIGTLDDIGIWNRALTEDEIEALFVAQETTLGCMDSVACNYSPEATEDDGSCDYSCCPGPGCCGVGMNWNSEIGECEITNPTDSNLDGCTDLNDLMDILSAYGDCAEVNYSLSFDGVDDYVEGSASSSLDVTNTNNITLSAWVKPNDFNGSQRIITHTAEGSDHQQYSLHVSDGQIYFISGASLFEQNGFNLSSSNLELGVWNNISMTYDGSAVRLYLDGNIVFEKLEPDYFPSDWMGYFYIGKRADGEEQFNGYIDEVSIWNSALTQEQIQSYMSTPPTGNEEGLVGYWDFNEGTGSTLTDQTSNGNDGVINGATWSTDVPTSP